MQTAKLLLFQGLFSPSAALAITSGLNSSQAYATILDATFPGGEVRGQLGAVPEPGPAGLLLLGLVPTTAVIRKRRNRA